MSILALSILALSRGKLPASENRGQPRSASRAAPNEEFTNSPVGLAISTESKAIFDGFYQFLRDSIRRSEKFSARGLVGLCHFVPYFTNFPGG
jgi:hypothetical protein